MKTAAVNTTGFLQQKSNSWLIDNSWMKMEDRNRTQPKLLSSNWNAADSLKHKYILLDKEVKSRARRHSKLCEQIAIGGRTSG